MLLQVCQELAGTVQLHVSADPRLEDHFMALCSPRPPKPPKYKASAEQVDSPAVLQQVCQESAGTIQFYVPAGTRLEDRFMTLSSPRLPKPPKAAQAQNKCRAG